jgi:hypothetical protein
LVERTEAPCSVDPLQSPWTLASVCQRWRTICLNYQPLWTSVRITPQVSNLGQRSLKLLGLQLLRSGTSRNLDVQIVWESYLIERNSVGRSIFTLLLLSSERWSTLLVSALTLKTLREFFNNRHMNTSRLRKLDILCAAFDYLTHYHETAHLVNLDDIRFPSKLTSLRIRCCTLFGLPRVQSLTHLVLRGPLFKQRESSTRSIIPGAPITANLLDLLKQTANTLRVCDIDSTLSATWTWSAITLEVISLPQLRVLRFIECGKEWAAGVLELLCAPALQELVLDDRRGHSSSAPEFSTLTDFIRRSALASITWNEDEEPPAQPQLTSLRTLAFASPRSTAVEKPAIEAFVRMIPDLELLIMTERARSIKQVAQVLTLDTTNSSSSSSASPSSHSQPLLPHLRQLTVTRAADDALDYILRMVESRLHAEEPVESVRRVDLYDRLMIFAPPQSIEDKYHRCKAGGVVFGFGCPLKPEDSMQWEEQYAYGKVEPADEHVGEDSC